MTAGVQIWLPPQKIRRSPLIRCPRICHKMSSCPIAVSVISFSSRSMQIWGAHGRLVLIFSGLMYRQMIVTHLWLSISIKYWNVSYFFENMKLLPQMANEIKKRFAENIGTSVKRNRIMSDKAKVTNEASLATNRRFSAIVFYLPLHKFWEKWVWKF